MKFQPASLREFKNLKQSYSAFGAGEGELAVAKNIEFVDGGKIMKRRPWRLALTSATLGTTVSQPKIISIYRTSAGTTVHYAGVGGTLFWVQSNSGSIVASTASLSSASCTALYDSKLFIFPSDTAQQMATYNGTAITLNVANIQADMAEIINSRLFTVYANSATAAVRSRVRFSELYSAGAFAGAGSWPVNNVVDVGIGDGDDIIAIIPLNNSLLIFKQTSTWIWYVDAPSPSDWVLRKINDSIGCVGRRTPRLIKGLVYFLAGDGVYRTDGTTFEKVSTNLVNASISSVFASTPSSLGRVGVSWQDYYLVSESAFCGEVFAYNVELDKWSIWQAASNMLNVVVDELFQEIVGYASFSSGQGTANDVSLLKMVSGYTKISSGFFTDWFGNYTVEIETGQIDFESLSHLKRIPSMNVAFESGASGAPNLSVEYYVNNNPVPISPAVSMTGVSGAGVHNVRVKGPDYFNTMRVKLINSSTDYFGLNGLDLDTRLLNGVGKQL